MTTRADMTQLKRTLTTLVPSWARRTLAAGILLLAAACADRQPSELSTTETPPTSGSDLGSVALQLTIPGGLEFDQISYDISGNGFHQAGTANVGAGTTFSLTVGGIPAGTGYLLKLTAPNPSSRVTGCAGSSTFAITGSQTTTLPVHMTCELAAAVVPPASVPVPRTATYALSALLAAAGLLALRRRARS
jgi:hypothetical protein